MGCSVAKYVLMGTEKMLDQAQIEHLATLCFINKIDEHLRIVSGVRVSPAADCDPLHIRLHLEIYYDDEKVDNLSFNLHNYDYEDIVNVARNIRSNPFILQEVDNLLAGDIE